MKDIRYAIVLLILLIGSISQQVISMHSQTYNITLAQNGVINSSFQDPSKLLDCAMPKVYIMQQQSHEDYYITYIGVKIYSIQSLWYPIQINKLNCTGPSQYCQININNQCGTGQGQINWIQIKTEWGIIQYLVDCDPSNFYKPFEWGLFLLIFLVTLTLTLNSLYSRAWSYGGVGYDISYRDIIAFNLILLIGVISAYTITGIFTLVAQIFGSILGALGVAVCVSQIIWLTHNKNLKKKVFKKIRIIDVISLSIGLIFIPIYWLSNRQWIVNDIMAICTIVALMKLLKIRSLSIAIALLASLLVLQILVGIFVHYIFQVSYNNYVINIFQNPLILVMPSITHQLYRKCAWLPITSVLFPGLVISYLRRFDISRGTHLYFLIGLGSFYFGSICWMIVDLQTVHSLPFAIISEPITILIVFIYSFRRNEFKTIWKGNFHDEELDSAIQNIQKETEIFEPTILAPSAYADLTRTLRGTTESSQYNYVAIQESAQYRL